MNRPQLIVITPVRNEAWVLEAFLTHCSSWADRIIIADQHSTDGSREIATRFPKVTLIDNPDIEMNQAKARQKLFEEVDRITGEKIVWAMDADEFLSFGFSNTAGWKEILESEPDSIFCFQWLYLEADFQHKDSRPFAYTEWVCHFSAETKLAELYAKIENRAVHETRVPCTKTTKYINIKDIQFVHLARINASRTKNKYDFYQVSTVDKLEHCPNAISIYRTYHYQPNTIALDCKMEITTADGRDITPLVRTSDHGQHYIDEMVTIFQREGFKKFRKLAIWDNANLKAAGVNYRPPFYIRLIHSYLRITQKHSHRPSVRAIDKLLKIIQF